MDLSKDEMEWKLWLRHPVTVKQAARLHEMHARFLVGCMVACEPDGNRESSVAHKAGCVAIEKVLEEVFGETR